MQLKLNLITVFIIFFLAFNIGNAQFDYSKFEYPDVERKALNASLMLNGGHSYSKLSNFDFVFTGFNQSGALDYSFLSNTRKKQKITTFFTDIDFSYSRQKNGLSSEISTTTQFNPYILFSNHIRNYKADNRYREFYYLANAELNTRKTNDEDVNNFSISPSIGYRIGIGRIEPASELFDAMFIVSDLKDRGFLLEMDQDVMFEFGRLLAQQRQQRILDSRRLYVRQMEGINSWLAQKIEGFEALDYVATSVIISDNWLFNQFFNRAIGVRKSIGIDLRTSYFESSPNFKQDRSQISIYGEVYNTNPVNQHAHRSMLIMAGISYARQNILPTNNLEDHTLSPFISAACRYTYYPISRTSLSLLADIRASYNFKSESFDNVLIVLPRIGFNMSYFLNYQTRINADITVRYSHTSADFAQGNINPDHEIYGNQTNVIFRESLFRPLVFSETKGFLMNGSVSILHSFY